MTSTSIETNILYINRYERGSFANKPQGVIVRSHYSIEKVHLYSLIGIRSIGNQSICLPGAGKKYGIGMENGNGNGLAGGMEELQEGKEIMKLKIYGVDGVK